MFVFIIHAVNTSYFHITINFTYWLAIRLSIFCCQRRCRHYYVSRRSSARLMPPLLFATITPTIISLNIVIAVYTFDAGRLRRRATISLCLCHATTAD